MGCRGRGAAWPCHWLDGVGGPSCDSLQNLMENKTIPAQPQTALHSGGIYKEHPLGLVGRFLGKINNSLKDGNTRPGSLTMK